MLMAGSVVIWSCSSGWASVIARDVLGPKDEEDEVREDEVQQHYTHKYSRSDSFFQKLYNF